MKKETHLQRKIRKDLIQEFTEIFQFKVHGGPFQKKGLPDIIGCILGLFFGIEVKIKGGKIKPHQLAVLRAIRKAGGIGIIATDSQKAITIIYKHLEVHYGKDVKKYFRALSKKRSRLRIQTKKSGPLYATWDWKNHHSIKGGSNSTQKRQYTKTVNRLS